MTIIEVDKRMNEWLIKRSTTDGKETLKLTIDPIPIMNKLIPDIKPYLDKVIDRAEACLKG